jgi:hypothetical protein
MGIVSLNPSYELRAEIGHNQANADFASGSAANHL